MHDQTKQNILFW